MVWLRAVPDRPEPSNRTVDCFLWNGYRVCQLDVVSDSPAVRFYGRMGMEILSESRVLPLEKHGIASHYRMVKNL